MLDYLHTHLIKTNIYSLITLFFLIIILSFVLRFVLRYLADKSDKSKNIFDDIIINALTLPLQALLWFIWLYYSTKILSTDFPWLRTFDTLILVLPIFIVAWLIFRLVSRTENILSKLDTLLDPDSVRLISRLIKIFVLIVALLSTAQYFGLSVTSILTFGGMGGIVIGFAAKDMLSNIFGGLMLQIDKPFSVGDWVRSEEKNFEGTVEQIGWRITKIRTFSKNPIYIPNSIFSTIPIETPSRMSNRRIRLTIGVRYDDMSHIVTITQHIKEMLKNNPDIDSKQTLIVNVNEFNVYSVDFFIYAFTKTKNWQEFHCIKQDVLIAISNIVENNGAEIAYPTRINMNYTIQNENKK